MIYARWRLQASAEARSPGNCVLAATPSRSTPTWRICPLPRPWSPKDNTRPLTHMPKLSTRCSHPTSGAPRKQRHTAKRIYDRIVEEHGYRGSYSSVQRYVRAWRRARTTGTGDGYLELEWAPGAAQVDFGNFEADIAGERTHLKLLVLTLPHSNARYAVACRSQRSECMCAALSEIFGWIGRAPSVLVLDNATEAGRRVRGEVSESHLFSLFRAHYRVASRYCNPYSGNEKGSVENAVGFLRRNLLVPVPCVGSVAELNALLHAGCDRLNEEGRARDGRATSVALAEDTASMHVLPGVPFDAVRWVSARADKRGIVTVERTRLSGRPGLALARARRRPEGGHRRDPRRPAVAGSRCCPARTGRARR